MGCGSWWAGGWGGEGNSHFGRWLGVNWAVGETGLGAVWAEGVCDPRELIVGSVGRDAGQA